MSNKRIYWLHTLSPTHAGIGRGVGYIDLPIDRDGVTNWPILRGSAFKGVWADHHAFKLIPEIKAGEDRRKLEKEESKLLRAAFGTAGEDNNSNAGALIPTDARLVCLPVRSFRGTFAWTTSPLCLQLLHRTLKLAGVKDLPPAPDSLPDTDAHHTVETALAEGPKVYLEDLDFNAKKCDKATAWANLIAECVFADDADWQQRFKERFVVLPNAAFDFLCETGTEVHTRVKISDETKIVEKGALWTEESLPAETILAGLIQCDRVYCKKGEENKQFTQKTLLAHFAKDPLTLQIGGKATVGRGQVRCVFQEV